MDVADAHELQFLHTVSGIADFGFAEGNNWIVAVQVFQSCVQRQPDGAVVTEVAPGLRCPTSDFEGELAFADLHRLGPTHDLPVGVHRSKIAGMDDGQMSVAAPGAEMETARCKGDGSDVIDFKCR